MPILSIDVLADKHHSVLVTYGEKEEQALVEIFNAAKNDFLSDNKSEIFRRGVLCCNALAKVNGQKLMLQLGQSFSDFLAFDEKERLSIIQNNIAEAKNLSYLAYSVLLAGKGSAQADLFVPVLNGIAWIEQTMNDYILQKKLKDPNEEILMPQSIRELAKDLGSTVRTIFQKLV